MSEKVVGKGKTYSWYLGSLDSFKTITLVYETKESEAKEQVQIPRYSSIIFSSRQLSGPAKVSW